MLDPTHIEASAIHPPRRQWWLSALVIAVLLTCGLAWGIYRARREQLDRLQIVEAKNAIREGRPETARARLIELTVRRPGDGEVAFLLGEAEAGGGRISAAIASWSKVDPRSPFAGKAASRRAWHLANTGHLSDAEALLAPWLEKPGPLEQEVRQSLEYLYRIEGRTQDVHHLIARSWESSADPVKVIRRLHEFDRAAFPVGIVRSAVEKGDPNDDRVWLARANLAIATGQFAEAARLLKECSKRRPDDLTIARTILDLAVLEDDPASAHEIGIQIPVSSLSQAEQLRLRSWLAGHTRSRDREAKALRLLVAASPGDISSWDRLAELAFLEGDKTASETFRRRKAEINVQRGRYETLMKQETPAATPAELASLASTIGLDLEARGWTLIARGIGSREPLETRETSDQTLSLGPDKGSWAFKSKKTEESPLTFTDEAEAAGLTFLYDNGHIDGRHRPPPEAMGGGVALLDYDSDGFLDVYLVQGGPFPPDSGREAEGDRLFRNKRDGTFEDVTTKSGIASFPRGYGQGVTVGDFDSDGRPDLFVTRWRSYALYRNKGDGTFEDVTIQAGLAGDRDWPTSAAFADLDDDGDLDLYVCHYLAYDEAHPRQCNHAGAPAGDDCGPLDFDPLPDHAFRNDGGKFVDVTREAGLYERAGRGLGVVAADLDGDGKIDLYVANDMSANYLYRNLGGFRFEEIGLPSGAATSAEGGYKAGMGVACGDLDGDGLLDLAVTNYYGESTTFYQNLGQGIFADHSTAIGLTSATRVLLGFGITFSDFDNDGRLDILSANGHVADSRPRIPWKMPLQLLRNGPSTRLEDVSDRAGPPFGPTHLGRGLASGDLDNDGRLDALIVCQNEAVVYLHNATDNGNHAIAFQLEGTRSNRDGVGAILTLTCEKTKQIAPRLGGGSYVSSSDPRVHFGLGSAKQADVVEVRWPSGQVDRFENLPGDKIYQLREGDPKPRSIENRKP